MSEAGPASLKASVLPGKEMEPCVGLKQQGEGLYPSLLATVPTLTPCASFGDIGTVSDDTKEVKVGARVPTAKIHRVEETKRLPLDP